MHTAQFAHPRIYKTEGDLPALEHAGVSTVHDRHLAGQLAKRSASPHVSILKQFETQAAVESFIIIKRSRSSKVL